MKFVVALVVSLVCGLSHAKSEKSSISFEGFWASTYASKMSRAKSPQDLLAQMQLSEKNSKLVLDFYKQKGVVFEQPTIELNETVVNLKFASANVAIDFSNFKKGFLKLNNTAIKLESFKTVMNYQSEVLMALNSKTASFDLLKYLIHEAHAADNIKRQMAMYVAMLFARPKVDAVMNGKGDFSFSSRDSSNKSSISDWLIETYVNHSKIKQSNNKKVDSFNSISITTFTCKGSQLDELKEADSKHKSFESFKKTSTGWEFNTSLGYKVLANREGTVTRTEGENKDFSPYKTGQNMFEQPYYFEAPLHFNECCAKAGCYEKVSAAFNIINARLRSDPKGVGSVQ